MTPAEAQLENLRNRGIEGSIVEEPVTDANGNPVLDNNGHPVVRRTFIVEKIPAAEYEVNKFFAEDIPCWFPGCEGLRKQYKEELAALQRSKGGCTSCAKGQLLRKFWPMVKSAISANENATNTRIEQIPGPRASRATGTPQKRSLLRRASAGLATLFTFGNRKGS